MVKVSLDHLNVRDLRAMLMDLGKEHRIPSVRTMSGNKMKAMIHSHLEGGYVRRKPVKRPRPKFTERVAPIVITPAHYDSWEMVPRNWPVSKTHPIRDGILTLLRLDHPIKTMLSRGEMQAFVDAAARR